MDLIRILEIILPIFLVALAGYIFRKFRDIDLKTLADFIIYVSAPALTLTLLSKQQMSLREISTIIFSAAFVILAVGLISLLIFKALRIKVPAGIYLPIMFMNSGFIGYPLALFLFGEVGFSRAIVYDITNAALIFTLGIYILTRGRDRWQIFKMPFIYAALLGITMAASGIRIPALLFSPLYMIGGTTIPIALFLIGCRLATIHIKSWKVPVIASLLRLGLGLGLGLFIVLFFKISGNLGKIIILSSSLPSAITTIAIAEEYNTDSEMVASIIAISTLLGIITIPLVLNWFIFN